MTNKVNSPNRQQITEEPETMDEMYERLRIEALPESLQQLVLTHHFDQFEALPSYAQRFVTEKV
jgi:tRNA U38,U39,U40 pseudouridine synthase TruA